MENMSFVGLGLLLGVTDTDGSLYPCLWTSIPHGVLCHLDLLCEHSHTLSPTLTYSVEFAHVFS
jgi:hypothetical protein